MTTWKRIIVHVDMDAFFAAVEQLMNPSLRGKPVIVGADPKGGKGRGVVSTASYEARKYGVHSAMPISRAYALCPHGIYLRPNGKAYARYSRQVVEILQQFSPQLEQISIDEAFLDVTHSVHLWPSVTALGQAIKERIVQETGLTASVGIAPSKSVAKIASDFQKPDGLTVVPPEKVLEFLGALPIRKLWGVGEKTLQHLQALGVNTVAQLREIPLEVLTAQFGKGGAHLYAMARGLDDRPVGEEETVKSVSNEHTFDTDVTDAELLVDTLMVLAEKVAHRLRQQNIRGKTIHLKLRYFNFRTLTRSRTLPIYTALTEEIFTVARELLESNWDYQTPVRLLGVGVSHLVSEQQVQLSIWDVENEKKLKAEKVLDELQQKFGPMGLTHARSLGARRKK